MKNTGGKKKNKTTATSQETKNSVEEMEEMSQVLDDTGQLKRRSSWKNKL